MIQTTSTVWSFEFVENWRKTTIAYYLHLSAFIRIHFALFWSIWYWCRLGSLRIISFQYLQYIGLSRVRFIRYHVKSLQRGKHFVILFYRVFYYLLIGFSSFWYNNSFDFCSGTYLHQKRKNVIAFTLNIGLFVVATPNPHRETPYTGVTYSACQKKIRWLLGNRREIREYHWLDLSSLFNQKKFFFFENVRIFFSLKDGAEFLNPIIFRLL